MHSSLRVNSKKLLQNLLQRKLARSKSKSSKDQDKVTTTRQILVIKYNKNILTIKRVIEKHSSILSTNSVYICKKYLRKNHSTHVEAMKSSAAN